MHFGILHDWLRSAGWPPALQSSRSDAGQHLEVRIIPHAVQRLKRRRGTCVKSMLNEGDFRLVRQAVKAFRHAAIGGAGEFIDKRNDLALLQNGDKGGAPCSSAAAAASNPDEPAPRMQISLPLNSSISIASLVCA